MRNIFKIVFFISFIFSITLFAVDEKTQAKNMVDEASGYYLTHGKDKAFEEINNPHGKFVKGEFYVFAYNMEGIVVAHPKNPKLIGKNLLNVPDVDGKTFRQDIINIAKSKGSGWVDYKYKNPETQKIEEKTTFCKKTTDIVFCCGVYK
jgi:hypothetical protein